MSAMRALRWTWSIRSSTFSYDWIKCSMVVIRATVMRRLNRGMCFAIGCMSCLSLTATSARDADDCTLGEFKQSIPRKFAAKAGLLGTAEGNVRSKMRGMIDPDRAALDLMRNLARAIDIRGPNRSAETI